MKKNEDTSSPATQSVPLALVNETLLQRTNLDPNRPVNGKAVTVRNLKAFYGKAKAIGEIDLEFLPGEISAIIGPSGCGKSTLIRCLNRMHEETAGGSTTGEVFLGDENIYARNFDPITVRRRIGMVFQKPNPFPTMSIYDNVIAGLSLNHGGNKKKFVDVVEQSLRSVALWDEVKDRLFSSGTSLSGGQQQRLCIARAIAVKPEVLLLDEPCSALDPVATLKIEDLLVNMRDQFTIILVTHNMHQAARVSDKCAFFLADEQRIGRLIEYSSTSKMFMTPTDARTQDYITGRFG